MRQVLQNSRRTKVLLATALLALSMVYLATNGYDFWMTRKYDPSRRNAANSVVILTTEWCPFCDRLRRNLQASSIPFREIDVEGSDAGYYAWRATGARGVPVTVVGERIIYGVQSKALGDELSAAGYQYREKRESEGSDAVASELR